MSNQSIEIKFGEHLSRIAPTFSAVAAIEQATGVGLMTLAGQLVSGALPIRSQAIMLAEFLRAGGEAGVTVDAVGKHLVDMGARSEAVMEPLSRVLRLALLGDRALDEERPA